MSDAVLQTIELVKAEVKAIESKLAEKRRMVNSLCAMVGQPLFYSQTDEPEGQSSPGIISGEFYGQPLATVVRRILEKRRAANQGPAAVSELYEAMLQGDYMFDTSSPENAKRVLRISLTKNPIFHRLPSGKYGLRVWYPAVKEKRSGSSKNDDPEEEEAQAFHQTFDAEEDSKKAAKAS